MKHSQTEPRIIIALDVDSLAEVHALVEQLDPTRCRLKVGKTLFTRFGPSLVKDLQQRGFDIFLDLKFHDIPQQVAGACRAAADLNVWMLTVHASGGVRMLEAAQQALAQASHHPILVAVTVLTSLHNDDLLSLGIHDTAQRQVLRLAQLAQQAGVDGLVCSPQEVTLLREHMSTDCCLVTPGIRLQHSAADDQQRTLTPHEAIQAGADYLVIGRPITQADNPQQSLIAIEKTIQR